MATVHYSNSHKISKKPLNSSICVFMSLLTKGTVDVT